MAKDRQLVVGIEVENLARKWHANTPFISQLFVYIIRLLTKFTNEALTAHKENVIAPASRRALDLVLHLGDDESVAARLLPVRARAPPRRGLPGAAQCSADGLDRNERDN